MPFDGKNWKPDLSLDGLINWLETKPPEQEYVWGDHACCLLAEFGQACEVAEPLYPFLVAHETISEETGTHGDSLACRWPRTYGAALQRAKTLKKRGKTA